jgi:Ser/Thr protein kinase RdoA (MazF antagonist)
VVMRLDRLAALVAAVDRGRGGPLVRSAACRWALDADAARYVRTSATCVHAVGGGYLRLAPRADRPLADVRAAAYVTGALAREGAPVVAPRPSTTGRLVEVVASGVPAVGDVSALLVDAAPGRACDLDELSGPDIERWGRAVALLHETGRRVDRSQLPSWPSVVSAAVAGSGDAAVGEAVEPVLERCENVLGPPDVVVHGDAQPDNAGWTGAGPVFFDLDDLTLSWAVADLAMAVRDAQPIDALDPPLTSTTAGQLFLRGYRQLAGLDHTQERALPLVQRLTAALTYGRLSRALKPAPTRQPEPDWMVPLRGRLTRTAERLRAALLTPLP